MIGTERNSLKNINSGLGRKIKQNSEHSSILQTQVPNA